DAREEGEGVHQHGPEPGGGQPERQDVAAGAPQPRVMVGVDLFETDTAAVWKEPGIDPASSQVEVFFIPAAPAAEKDGSITNTMRMAQWHVKAVESPGDARSDAAFVVDLGSRVKGLYRESRA